MASAPDVEPRSLERHFARSTFVAEVACVGWDPASGWSRLIVVPDRGAMRANGLTGVRELLRFEFETLAAQHRPPLPVPEVGYSFDPLPRTADGAIDRDALTARPDVHLVLRPRTPLPDTATSAMVRDAIVAVSPGAADVACDADTNLELDLDLDSLARAAVFAEVERRAGHAPTTSGVAWDEVLTVGDLVSRTDALTAAGQPDARPHHRDIWQDVLDQAPANDPFLAELERRKPARAALLWLMLRAVRLAMWPVIRIDVTGRASLPARGPALICPNHESFLDAFVVSAILPYRLLRQVFYLGATEYFATPLMGAVARAINLVPVDSDRNLARAMQVAAMGLRRGKILVVFPEGERSIDGTVRTFRDGTSRLAMATGSPMVPVATRGMFGLWPRGFPLRWRMLRPWRPARVRVVIGAPILASSDRSVEDTTRVLKDTVLLLWEAAAEK